MATTKQQGEEEPVPSVMHAFGAHDENGLRRVEETDSRTRSLRSRTIVASCGTGCAGRIHKENRILRLRRAAENAANRQTVQRTVWQNESERDTGP